MNYKQWCNLMGFSENDTDTKKELSAMLTTFSYGSTEQLAMRIVSFYDHKIEIGRKHYARIGMVALLTINHAAFREFIESIENAELKDCIIDLYNSNLNRRHTIDTEIVLTPMRFSGQETEVKKRINQMLQSVSQQKAPIRKAHGAELQAPRNQSLIDQLRHYKPTEEQKAQALKDMANTNNDMETEQFVKWYKHFISNGLDVWLYMKWRASKEDIAKNVINSYNEEVEKSPIIHPNKSVGLLMPTIDDAFRDFMRKISDETTREFVRAEYEANLKQRSKGGLVEITNDFVEAYDKALPRQIEMPTFLNVSEYKIVNFIFDKLEGILPK